MMPMRPKPPTLALANLAIAVLLLALAVLVLVILKRISTYSELIRTSLGVVKLRKRVAMQCVMKLLLLSSLLVFAPFPVEEFGINDPNNC